MRREKKNKQKMLQNDQPKHIKKKFQVRSQGTI